MQLRSWKATGLGEKPNFRHRRMPMKVSRSCSCRPRCKRRPTRVSTNLCGGCSVYSRRGWSNVGDEGELVEVGIESANDLVHKEFRHSRRYFLLQPAVLRRPKFR